MKPLDADTLPLFKRHLIEASAGTGKTYTITSLFLRLLVEQGLPVDEILVVTFTEAAAHELKSRIRQRLKGLCQALDAAEIEDSLYRRLIQANRSETAARVDQALLALDRAEIATIHGFLHRVLETHAFESGVSFDAALVTDHTPLLEEVAHDFFALETAGASDLFVDFLELQGIGPKRLTALIQTYFSHPDLKVRPKRVAVADPSEALSRAFFEAKAIWCRDREAIGDFLMTDKGLKHTSYSKRYVPAWQAGMDSYLSHETPVIPRPEHQVARFSRRLVALAVKPDTPAPAHPFFDACEHIEEAMALFSAALLDFKLRCITGAKSALDEIKRSADIFTFDDLLSRMDEALDGPESAALIQAVRSRFKAVLIDEFQDTDPVQYRIFHRIYEGTDTPFFLIGDPKQSIYAFRGADVFTYFKAVSDIGDEAYTLGINWRSSPSLISAVNTLFQNVERPFYFERIRFEPAVPAPSAADPFVPSPKRAPMEIRWIPRTFAGVEAPTGKISARFADQTLPDLAAADLTQLLSEESAEGRLTDRSKVAVLVRTNDQAAQIQASLKAAGIPGVIWGASSVFCTEEAAELALVLDAIAAEDYLPKRLAALSTRILGLFAQEIAALQNDADALDTWSVRFGGWHREWGRQGFIQMFHAMLALDLNGETIGARILKRPDGERVMTNLRHLAELLGQKAAADRMGMLGLLEWFSLMRAGERGAMAADEAELRLESDEAAVRIITVHKAKGLEFDLVYCPYLWNGVRETAGDAVIYHDPEGDHSSLLDLGTEEIEAHRAIALAESEAEWLRLAYVALTRAKHRTVMVWGAFHGSERSPLAYLLHRPKGEVGLTDLFLTIKGMDDDAMEADLDRLCRRSNGAIRMGRLTPLLSPTLDTPALPPVLACRHFDRDLPLTRGIHSFTSLTSHAMSALYTAEGQDHDELAAAYTVKAPDRDAPAADPTLHPLTGFDCGARAGSCLHGILEHLDFTDLDPGHLLPLVAEKLDAFGLAPEWLDAVSRAVAHMVRTPLDTQDPTRRLADIPKERLFKELEFLLPIRARADRQSRTAEAVARLLEKHSPALPHGYANEVLALGFDKLTGFMRGFIDLVFEQGGRFYIADYKSNYLGPREEDYTLENLATCMASHHYYLQYHLYAAALHRFLERRLAGYDFDRDFGGVYYLFLRGMGSETRPMSGIFFDRPAKPLVLGIIDLLSPSEAAP